MTKYWLLKSEPSTWSWEDQLRKGDKGEGWDGVRNYQASNNTLKEMRVGDLAFFYHSVKEKQIVGIVDIIKTYHPDPTDKTNRFGMVTVKAIKSLEVPVTLKRIKEESSLSNLALVRQSRLSVVPVSEEEWNIILKLGNTIL